MASGREFLLGESLKVKTYNLDDLERVHISIRGFRQIKMDGHEKNFRGKQTALEIYNFSMRWLNGVYDDWNDPSQGVLGSDKVFHKLRTTPMQSYALEYFPLIAKSFFDRVEEGVDFNYFLDNELGKLPPGKSLFGIRDSFQLNFPGKFISDYHHEKETKELPITDPDYIFDMAGINEKYSVVKRMNPSEGVEFLFGRALPSLQDYLKRISS